MAEFAIDDEDGGELHQAEVVGGLLLPPDEQAAEAVEPRVGDLDDPPPGWVTVRVAGWWQGVRCHKG